MSQNTNLKPHSYKFNASRTFPSFSKPHIVGHFSLDANRQFVPDASKCKYLKIPEPSRDISLDLNLGYEIVVPKPESAREEKLDRMLQFILTNLDKLRIPPFGDEIKYLKADFVCFRGLLKLIMCTPYEFRDNWTILATKYKGTIYLCALETEQAKHRRINQNGQSHRFCSYGFKFEQYIFTDDPDKEPNTDQPVVESEEFCCMYQTTLDGQRLLYGAEMDGIESDRLVDFSNVDLNTLKFVEAKVRFHPKHQGHVETFHKFVMRNWWCQSFLVGIENLAIGFRNDEGIVDVIEKIPVNSLSKKGQDYWSPSICMNFVREFLEIVKQLMCHVNCSKTVYKFDFDRQLCDNIRYEKFDPENMYAFLPDWYVNNLK